MNASQFPSSLPCAKLTEDEVRQLHARLEQRVAERTTGLEATIANLNSDIAKQTHVSERLNASLSEIIELKAALDEHAIVAITDPQGKITFVNDKFCAISKYSLRRNET